MAHDRSEWPHDKCTEVGEAVCLVETIHGDDQHLAGFLFCHETPSGHRCVGGVNVDPHFGGRPLWTMSGSLAGGDLTLSPSIRCVTHDPGPNGRARSLAARNRLEEALIEERQRRLREAQPPLDAATFLRSFRPKPEPGVWRAKVAHAVDLAGIASRLKA